MSTDARLSTGLPAHPKTKKLIRRCGETGAWHLVVLILWARANRPDGDLDGMTGEDIELAVDWRGEPDAFVAALVDVGFLEGAEGAYHLHDWAEHQPWAVGSEARSERARWTALCKHHGKAEAARQMPDYAARIAARSSDSAASSTDSDAHSSDDACTQQPSRRKSAAPSPSPSPSPRAKAGQGVTAAPPPDLLGDQRPPADLQARVAQITQDAIETFNASPLVRTHGGELSTVSPKVGREKRQSQVRRCIRVARSICEQDLGGPTITREFWETYWAEVHRDDFFAGRRSGGAGHENWRPDFEFLTREATMLKVYDRASAEEVA